ncbi:MAG: hypothetical protein H0W50_09645 [Parachlamydiaceae bacterium]|nr:hypothetical protein [Parachlamydiaceae bacterium]
MLPVYGDSGCIKQKAPRFINMSQSTIDSIYERNYNAILFKDLKAGDFEYKVLKTEDAENFQSILIKFFAKD